MSSDNKAALYQQELNLSQFIFLSWEIFRNNFSILVLTSLLLFLPFIIITEVVPELPFAAIIVLRIAELTVSAISSLAFYYIISNSLDNNEVTISQALAFSFSRLGKALWTLILSILIITVLSLLIIPGIIWGVYYSFALFAVAATGIWGIKALTYSKKLVAGRWWKVLGYLIAIGLLIFLAVVTISIPLAILLPNQSVYLLFVAMLVFIVTSFFFTAQIILFINLDHNPRQNHV